MLSIQAIKGRAVHSTVNRAEYSTHSRVFVFFLSVNNKVVNRKCMVMLF